MCVSKCPRSLQDPLLPLSACWPAVSLKVVTDQTVFERASGELVAGSSRWVLSLDMALTLPEAGISLCQGLTMSSSWQDEATRVSG